MTLVSSGPISMGDINVELGRARAAQISLDIAEEKKLFQIQEYLIIGSYFLEF
jgi:hypothetical protein